MFVYLFILSFSHTITATNQNKGLHIHIHVHDSGLYIICVFYSRWIRTLVAMATESFHRLIMGKVEIGYFSAKIADI